MKYKIITNNPLVNEKYSNYNIEYIDSVNYLEVLIKARDLIHKGYKLLSHPLSGSIKPNETPYKSLLISLDKEKMDYQSVMLIEKSIETFQKFIEIKDKTKNLPKAIYEDFMEVDYRLISSAIESI